jgi:hypothetical protein
MATKPTFFFVEMWGRKYSEPVPGGTRYFSKAEYYTFKINGDDDTSVRDDRHVDELIESLLGKSSDWKNEMPVVTDGFSPWFTVVIGVSDTRKSKSHYTVDYFKHAGCPLEIIDFGMNIYRLIKRNIKNAIRRGQAK